MKKSFVQIIALIFTITYILAVIVLAVIQSQWVGNTISRVWQDQLDGEQRQAVVNQPIFFVLFGIFVVSLVAAIIIHKKKQCKEVVEWGNKIRKETTKWGYVRDVMIGVAVLSFFPAVNLGFAYIVPVLTIALGIIMILVILVIPPIIGFAIYRGTLG